MILVLISVIISIIILIWLYKKAKSLLSSEKATNYQFIDGSVEQDIWGVHGTVSQKITYPKIVNMFKYGDVSVPKWLQDDYNQDFPILPAPQQKNIGNTNPYCC